MSARATAPASRVATSLRGVWLGFALGLAGAVVLLLAGGAAGAWERLMPSYAAAYFAALGLALGALLWVQIAHVSQALWLVPLRRQLENAAALLPLLAVMMVPLLLGRRVLYPWAAAGRGSTEMLLPLVNGGPSAWLHAGVAFAVWVVVAELLRAGSRENDHVHLEVRTQRQRLLAGMALPAMGLTLTMFAFDFVMTLDDGFRSTIYGLYLFAGASVAGLSTAAVAGELARRRALLPPEIGQPHFFALGKMLFAMVLFWAYIAFSQLLLIWIANLPVEVGWYLTRTRGAWAWVALAVGVTSFGVPFVVLLSRRFKMSPTRLAWLAAFLLGAHYLDVAWLVIPPLRPAGPYPTLADLGAVLLVAGALLAFASARARGAAAFATADPMLERALAFEDS
jgi:hypothetical protein